MPSAQGGLSGFLLFNVIEDVVLSVNRPSLGTCFMSTSVTSVELRSIWEAGAELACAGVCSVLRCSSEPERIGSLEYEFCCFPIATSEVARMLCSLIDGHGLGYFARTCLKLERYYCHGWTEGVSGF